MLSQGMSNKAIAAALGISEGTVKNHITEILRMLNATNRTQAATRQRGVTLDADEYLHLAVHASLVGDHHACMTYLKEVLHQQPDHATALYLLATVHAEIGLFDRAVNGLEAALTINPSLDIARFQLGFILLQRGRIAEARAQFVRLKGSRDPAVHSFSEGMLALTDNDVTVARQKLTLGISQPTEMPAIRAMMRRVLDTLAAERSAPAPGTERADAQPEPLILGAYRKQ